MGSQIYIRPVAIEDAPHILLWENNVENWSVSNNNGEYSIFDIVQLVKDLEDIKVAQQGRWIICRNSDDLILGAVDLTGIDFIKREASVGILIAEKQYRRKGYAYESLEAVAREAIGLGLDRLFVTVQCQNIASQKLFEKSEYLRLPNSDDANMSEGAYIDTILFEKWLRK